jgi:hypothetical protein
MKTALTLGMVTLLVAACGELPDPPAPVGTPNGLPVAGAYDPVNPLDQNDPPPAVPTLATLPVNYGYETIPVRGGAVPNETVFVEGGKAPVATDAAVDGRFCVDVPLQVNQTQTLKVFVQDERGVTSAPAEATVNYDPSIAQTQVPPQPLVDLAPDVPIYSDSTPKDGVFENLTDGNPATSVTMSSSTLWLDLGELYVLSTIELLFPDSIDQGDDTFATEYQILASAAANPTTPPSCLDSTWTLLYDIYPGSGLPYGDGGVEKFALAAPFRARFVAIYLIENNKTDWLSSESIRVSEVKVVGRSAESLPSQPQTPTCANGKQP